MLTAEQLQLWQDEGALRLDGFFGPGAVREVNAIVEDIWRRRPRSLVVDDLTTSTRCRMNRVRPEDREHHFKLNDLYLDSKRLREVALEPTLVDVVGRLLGDRAVLCNTLNLERSSEQDYHVDSLYMTPLSEGSLVAAWIALEDCSANAGPLTYYPGSHRIPPYRFSRGSHFVPGEMGNWAAYMERQISALGLTSRVLEARSGDLFVWHANLLHGARPVQERGATRRSLVCHYFGLRDSRRRGYSLRPLGQAFWIKRPPQEVSALDRVRGAFARRTLAPLRSWRYRLGG